jgi:hypothetical protein
VVLAAFTSAKKTSNVHQAPITPRALISPNRGRVSGDSAGIASGIPDFWAIKTTLAAIDRNAVNNSDNLAASVPSKSLLVGASKPSHPATTAGNAKRKAGASVSTWPSREEK